MIEPNWLALEELVELNQAAVEQTDEPFLLRDEALLDSALHVPRFMFDYDGVADVVALAASLMLAISRNHPFLQGNKRTGFAAALIFLEMNGYVVDLPDSETVAEEIIHEIAADDPLIGFEEVLRRCIDWPATDELSGD